MNFKEGGAFFFQGEVFILLYNGKGRAGEQWGFFSSTSL